MAAHATRTINHARLRAFTDRDETFSLIDRRICLRVGAIFQMNGHQLKGETLALPIREVLANNRLLRVRKFKSNSRALAVVSPFEIERRASGFLSTPVLRRRLVKYAPIAAQHRNAATCAAKLVLPF